MSTNSPSIQAIKDLNSTHQTEPCERIYLQHSIFYRSNYGRKNKKGILKNISLTGAFLEWNKEKNDCQNPDLLKFKDKILLFLSVEGRVRKVKSSVIWRNKWGCGVQFQPSNQRDFQIVDDLIYFTNCKKENRRQFFSLLLNQILES